MDKPAKTGSAVGRASVQRASCILAAAVVVLGVWASGDRALGQTATRPAAGTTSTNTGEAPVPHRVAGTAPASSQSVSGVNSSMSVDQLIEAGSAATAAGRLEEARKTLLAAVARNGRNLRALSQLAYAYERSAEPAKAEGAGLQVTAQADRFIDQAIDVYLTAGGVALGQDLAGTAEKFYDRILLLRPVNAKAMLGLARIYAATGRRLQAIDRYREYIASPPGKADAKAYLELAELYLDGMNWRLAMQQVARAEVLPPEDPDLYMVKARAFQQGGQMAEAIEAANKARELAPDRAKYRNLLAELDLAQGDGEQASIESLWAINLTRKAMQAAPDDVGLLKEIGGYYETYEKALRSLLNEGKANPVVRVDLARAIQEHGVIGRTLSLRRALKVLAEVAPEGKDDARLLEELAGVHRALGETKEARETCQRLLKVDPGNTVAARILKETAGAGER